MNLVKKLKNKKKIEILTLSKHMEIIIKLCFIETNNIICCYDDIFLNDFKSTGIKNKIKENNLPVNFKNYYNNINIYEEYLNPIFSDDKDIILNNSIFNRIYIFNFKKYIYRFAPNNKYNINVNNINIENINNINLLEIFKMIKKDNKTLPKYFAHTFEDTTNVNNKFNYITAFLTVFAEDFVSNIEITEQDSIKYFNQICSLIPNITERECQDLTCVLLNNTIFNQFN